MAKLDNRNRSFDNIALMNARKKEKKVKFQLAKKPTDLALWVDLTDRMVNWYRTNPSKNINDFARLYNYPPFIFKKWALEEDTPDYFKEGLQLCLYICADRRDTYMDYKDKLYLQYLKQLPLYDLDLKEYEKEMKMVNKETEANGNVSVYIDGVKVEQKKDKE